MYPRLAPTSEWDTAAAHIIVTEAGGQVMQAGLCDNKGKPLEDWKVGGRLGEAGVWWYEDCMSCSLVLLGLLTLRCMPGIPHMPPLPQAALARQQPVQYNKENPLNPFFVVYGKRKQ